ncbi:hypothetical protein SA2016_0926 [Sinomonas atrocyanea]|uniref:Uncharacterized protein n=1 Tax=Sinomonas atrocyanea TaxID=37927 RepID=A0A127A1T7_9MICC|nr:ankyrin repeat domain-containing protein [Sinomonas atrocyanea]AMM31612.1 hypothetical protein SA2016_0926 [Sinomonas atrocyanea]GEB64246.1 hypothetical protein SAT01_16940 [Sinomonas atrocyanea]GGG57608.1 hypothetical protein GCM10007172_05550 [Sinomonas atrocyanea]
MPTDEDRADVFVSIRSGDVEALQKVLAARPVLAASRLGGMARGRTPLHVVTDWPGYFPNGPRIAQVLIGAGADVDARENEDGTGETPLHWTASSDDADVARVLIDAGADLEAPDGSIGTPLDNAVGYGCWNVARLLVERGARVEKLWHASALGLLDRIEDLLGDPANSTEAAIDQAFWHACAAGYRRAAALLYERGANLAFTPAYGHGTVLDAASSHGTQRGSLIGWLEQLGAHRTTD